MCNRKIVALFCGLTGLLLTACTEKPQTYTPGVSTAASDPPPYATPPFAGNRSAWEAAVSTRMKGQNEYVRVQ
ncbi:hypothetical protein [Hydrogenophilus thiooxidans]|uniref:hypothetical protein n=1 Tax=Hydrogenophilus thiooxidans TaxID=2820326 RepID=UPI001C2170F1|nr:hypothetical protein [Hydrogenophilus thiooxidans]